MVDEEITPEKTSEGEKRRRLLKKRSSANASVAPLNGPGEPVTEDESTSRSEAVPAESAAPPAVTAHMTGMVGQERFQEILHGLRALSRVIEDNRKEVDFEGPDKDAFLNDVESAYPVFGGP